MGGAKGTRTPDPLPARQVLYQLSYSPEMLPKLYLTTAPRPDGGDIDRGSRHDMGHEDRRAMKISSILTQKGDFVATVSPEATVSELLALLAEHRIGAVVVADPEQRLVGIVSERDVARACHNHGASALDQPVRAIMTELVVTCGPDASTEELMGLMTEQRVRHIPVLDEDTMVGIVSIGDIVKARLAELETERDAMQAYISS